MKTPSNLKRRETHANRLSEKGATRAEGRRGRPCYKKEEVAGRGRKGGTGP